MSDTALVVTNEGNVPEDLGLRIKDEDDKGEWTCGPLPVALNQYVLWCRLCEDGDIMNSNDLTTSVQWCDGTNFSGGGNDMAAAASENMWFSFKAPSSVSGEHAADPHIITVEVSCREAE